MQYMIYVAILFMAIYVGKSMFGNDRTIKNVSRNVSQETSSDTMASERVEETEKLEYCRWFHLYT